MAGLEGTIATNGKDSIILKGGQWVPYTGAPPAGAQQDPYKVGDSDAISHAWDIVDSINGARDLAGKPLATGTAAAAITGIPVVGGLVGQNRANLQTKLGAVAGDLRQLGIRNLYQQTGQKGVGSVARNQAEQQALQNSLAPLGYVDTGGTGGHVISGPQPDAPTLLQGLDTAQHLYYRHLARLYGLNPDDPATITTLDSANKDPNIRQTLLQQAAGKAAPPASGTPPPSAPISGVPGDHITGSAPLPPIVGSANGVAPSSGSQVTVDPKLLAIKPQLEALLAQDPSKVSNDDIVNFMVQHGLDPNNYRLQPVLQFRNSHDGAVWRQRGGNYNVDPRVSQELTGFKKFMAGATNATPGGVPVGATAAGAADAYLLGGAPDIAGIVHGVTGAGPTREDVINARDVSAEAHPYGTFAGNAIGGVANPLARGGGAVRSALLAGTYGGLGSEDPSLGGRLSSAALAALTGLGLHGAAKAVIGAPVAAYRAGSSIAGGEGGADAAALARASRAMPQQDVPAAAANLAALRAAGATAPAAAALDRGGQDFLAKLAGASPAARTAAEGAAAAYRQAMPAELADSFDQAIAAAAPPGAEHTAAFLSRPTREVAKDVQDMAGREYETGIAPIANEPVQVTPDIIDALTHERTNAAIKDALASHQMDDKTRQILRNLPSQLKALNINIPGANPDVAANIQAQYAKGIPLNVSATRNIATALDRTASKLQEGSEGGVQLRALSRDLRQAIGDQYPEFTPVNERYARRMRAIDAMDAARRNYLGETPEQIDALAKSASNLSDAPNQSEFRGVMGAEPSGPVQPSNRQFAITGAREAATTKAGAGTGSGGSKLLQQLAEGPNQQARNKLVLGSALPTFTPSVAAKATVANAVDRVTAGQSDQQTANWFRIAKRAVMTKLTGGVSHYQVAHALSDIPNMSGEDSARVVRIFLDAGSADQALTALQKSYGYAKARTIMARMAALGGAPSIVRGTPSPQQVQQAIGSPVGP